MNAALVDTGTPVVILKLVHPSAALGVARSLGRLGARVIGVHPRRWDAVAVSRYVADVWRWDLSAHGDDENVAFLCERASGLPSAPVLVAVDDHGALFVERHAAELRRFFLMPAQPPGLAERLGNKAMLQRVAEGAGVPSPRASFPTTHADVAALADDLPFPVVVKPIDSGRLDRAKVSIVTSRDELLRLFELVDADDVDALMIQEFIPGGIESVWMFNGYFDREGRCLFGATGRKLRQRPPYTGMTSLGVCVPNREVDELSRRWLADVGYRGVVDMGYRFDARDGTYKVLDVNPRIGATFRLFTGPDGIDVARALYLDLTGQHVPESRPRPGRKWLVEPFDLASSYRYWRDGRLQGRAWLRSFRGVEESAWFARDDLKPFVEMIAAYARALLRRSGPSG